MKITHINHASLLLKNEVGHYLWIDPWVISPAFETWTQDPSPTAQFILDILNIPKDKISIIISHGHDDHIDEYILSKYFYGVDILIPKFPVKGFYRRAERTVGKNVIEVGSETIDYQGWEITNFIGTASPDGDDTIFTISEGDQICIHANDNWQEYDGKLLNDLKSKINNYKIENRRYCVQLGIADTYPHGYINFDDQHCERLMNERVLNYSSAVQQNIKNLNVEGAFIYANQAAVDHVLERSINYEEDVKLKIVKECALTKQLYPGAIVEDFQNYNSDDQLKAYLKDENIFDYLLKKYTSEAKEYIERKHKNPKEFDFEFSILNKSQKPNKNKITYSAAKSVWSNILIGKSHFEAITIGGLGVIHKPDGVNIAEGHHWLNKWAYKQQNVLRSKGIFDE